ncbi:fungal zn, 2-cys(6) binuclear cluster domain protein [Rhizoctonia solani 123E]|uniref:Fungal zn, 2-cys(6) binuclear cluster domain protein n=1 Tax=Rhizoctonia solani 123E TaxID=1423351 RepID=A0A074RNP5_9AGAM|nr:fungal zn, 2-cys(6) binuclear cluster domain protein [Rhizoctonia solani 123E]
MAPSRRTRSGRTAPSAPTKRIRTKGGCLTCRIRRKKCDESREFANGCETCARLHIECLGYSTKRPDWLKGARVDDYKRKIKHFLADHSARSSARSPEEAFLELHHLRNSLTPPRQHSESSHTDSDSDSESDAVSTTDLKPQQFSPAYSIPPLSVMPELWMPETPIENSWVVPSLDFLPMGFQEDSSPTAMYPHYNPFASLDLASTLVGPMRNEECGSSMQLNSSLDFEAQVTVSQYEHPAPDTSAEAASIWQTTLGLLPLAQTGDPEGFEAVAEVLDDGLGCLLSYNLFVDPSAETEVARQLKARQRAQRCLLKSGYDSPLSRAVTSLWMMRVTLSQGHFDSWGNCLDVVIEWIRSRLSSPSVEVSSLSPEDQRVLSHGIWVDLVATATTQRVPLHIDLYRRILHSPDPIVSDCPNTVALAFVEAIALAANPSHLSQARMKLQQLRASLAMPLDDPDSMSTAQVHTAGINLYLETVASRGMVDPPVQEAVEAVCNAVGKQPRRAFAFWVFLAGCHTKDSGHWTSCSTIMDELIQTGGEDGALKAACGVMNETYNARKHGGIAPDFWVQRMRERNILLA